MSLHHASFLRGTIHKTARDRYLLIGRRVETDNYTAFLFGQNYESSKVRARRIPRPIRRVFNKRIS